MELAEKIKNVKDQIKKKALSCSRDPDTIRLVAVSKTQPAQMVKRAIDAGVDILGENYIKEAREKINALSICKVSWHFIGHLQTNKAKYAVRLFDLIHSVDSLKLSKELNKQAEKINKIQNILVQVNISGEVSKSGVNLNDVLSLVKNISAFKYLSIKGLMTMPPFFEDVEKARPYFKTLYKIKERIKEKNIPNVSMNELSMGMTGDYKVAIEEGATLVRIGTAIFGKRE